MYISRYTYNYFTFFVILFISIIIILSFQKRFNRWQDKIIVILLLGGTTVYSGLGISSTIVDDSYIPIFSLFLVFEGAGLIFGSKMFKEDPDRDEKTNGSNYLVALYNSTKILRLIAIIYWIIILVRLVYPTNHLGSLFSIRLDITGVFENKIAKRTNTLVYVLGLVSTILAPFYYIYLAKIPKSRIILLLILEKYFDMVVDGYIGRTALMMLVVQIIIIAYIIETQGKGNRFTIKRIHFRIWKKENRASQKTKYQGRLKRAILIVLIAFIIAIPFLASYQYSRQGRDFGYNGFSNSLLLLLDSEINYPKRYDMAASLVGEVVTPVQYLYWFITLPIPKEIISLPSAVSINNAFSTILTGANYGARGFSISLVSLLGEGILLWGKYFCFIHAFFIGFVWGAINSFLSKNKGLLIYQVLFISRTLNMIRGGSQGSIARVVNTLIPFLVVVFIMYNISSSDNKFKHQL